MRRGESSARAVRPGAARARTQRDAIVVDECLWFSKDRGAPSPSNWDGSCDDSVMRVVLGAVRGVPFGFTDTITLPDDRVVFLAPAEDSPDVYRAAEVLGARVGLLAGDRAVLCEITGDTGRPTALELAVVTDMDDPAVPVVMASLLSGTALTTSAVSPSSRGMRPLADCEGAPRDSSARRRRVHRLLAEAQTLAASFTASTPIFVRRRTS